MGVGQDHVTAGDLGCDQVLQRPRVDVDQRADVVQQAPDLGTDSLRLGGAEDRVAFAGRRDIIEASHNAPNDTAPPTLGKGTR